MMIGREISRLTKVTQKSKAIRTIIPKKIVEALQHGTNEFLEWQIATQKDEKYVCVKKLRI